MWPQEQLVQTLVALFRVHTDTDLEKMINLNGHFFRRLKDMHMQQTKLKEEDGHEKRLLMETKESLKVLQTIQVHIKFEFAALLHYTVNYNLMSQVEVKFTDVLTHVFSSMRQSHDTSKWNITIMTGVEFQRCLSLWV